MPGIRIWPTENQATVNCGAGATVRKVSDRCWLTVPYGQQADVDRMIAIANLHPAAR